MLNVGCSWNTKLISNFFTSSWYFWPHLHPIFSASVALSRHPLRKFQNRKTHIIHSTMGRWVAALVISTAIKCTSLSLTDKMLVENLVQSAELPLLSCSSRQPVVASLPFAAFIRLFGIFLACKLTLVSSCMSDKRRKKKTITVEWALRATDQMWKLTLHLYCYSRKRSV